MRRKTRAIIKELSIDICHALALGVWAIMMNKESCSLWSRVWWDKTDDREDNTKNQDTKTNQNATVSS